MSEDYFKKYWHERIRRERYEKIIDELLPLIMSRRNNEIDWLIKQLDMATRCADKQDSASKAKEGNDE